VIISVDEYIIGRDDNPRPQSLEVDDKYRDKYEQICNFGQVTSDYRHRGEPILRFTAELLYPSQISICLEHRTYGDYFIDIVPNQATGNAMKEGFEKFLENFNPEGLQKWIDVCEGNEEG
jgi:hypothetical protein